MLSLMSQRHVGVAVLLQLILLYLGYVTSPKVESVKFRQLTPIAWQGELLALECRATPSDIVIKLLRVHAFHDDLNTQELVFKYVGDVYNTHDFSGAWLGRGQSLLDGAGMYINVTSATVKQDGGRFNCEIREDDNTSEEDNNGYVMINVKPFNHTITYDNIVYGANGGACANTITIRETPTTLTTVECVAYSRPEANLTWTDSGMGLRISDSIACTESGANSRCVTTATLNMTSLIINNPDLSGLKLTCRASCRNETEVDDSSVVLCFKWKPADVTDQTTSHQTPSHGPRKSSNTAVIATLAGILIMGFGVISH